MNITFNQKFFRFCCLAISFLFYSQLAIARGRVNFVLGKVYVKYGSVKKPVKLGMVIPGKALIITGKRSRVSIYDYRNSKLITIRPGMKVSLSGFQGTASSTNVFQKLMKNSLKKRRSVTTVAAARGSEEGKVDVDWDEGNDATKTGGAKMRIKEWKLYSQGQYKKILKLTKGATDTEGMFLEAVAIFMIYGPRKEKEIVKRLNFVQKMARNRFLRDESNRINGIVHFNVGKYMETIQYLGNYVRPRKDDTVSDLVYFMLIKSNQIAGNEERAREYRLKMEKYHSGSNLLGRL